MYLILIGCNRPNKYQLKSTKRNIECFEQLINELHSNENFRRQLIDIRASKIQGNHDHVRISQQYRYIDSKEIEHILPTEWKNKCFEQLTKDRDFKGLRFINKDTIIIEIDQFDRHTFSERYSRYGTTEIHRILISNKEITNHEYRFMNENIIATKKLENGWVYEITQKTR